MQFSFPAQRRSSQGRASDSLKFSLRTILVEGATVLGPADYDPLIAPLLTRPITLPEVVAVADAIQAKYVALGHVLTRVYVPPQEIADATMRIRVLEGFVGKVLVDGADDGTAARLQRFAEPVTARRPAVVVDLERAILVANDLPGVDVAAVLRPGEELGAAELILTPTLTELEAVVGVGNRGNRFAGPWSAFADVAANDLLGFGEQLALNVSNSLEPGEQTSIAARYLQPLGSRGLTALTTASFGRGRPGAGLAPFALRTRSYAVGQRFSYPVIRSRRESLVAELGWSVQQARIDLLGERFSTDDWRTVDARVTYADFGRLRGTTVLTAGVVQGLDIFDATATEDDTASRIAVDPGFTKVTAEAQRFQSIAYGVSLLLGVAGQYSPDPLFAGEEFGLGGARFGRGYDASDLSSVNGLGASAELRRSFAVDRSFLTSVDVYGFYDWGRVWRSETANAILASAGFGLVLALPGSVGVTLELAQPLRDLPVAGVQTPSTRYFLELVARF